MKYGIRLNTEPMHLVHIFPSVSMVNDSKVYLPPQLQINQTSLTFGSSNWSEIQTITAQALQNDVDHDDVEFKISHKIVTEDTIFATKASQSPMFAVLTVTDDDTVGINLNTMF